MRLISLQSSADEDDFEMLLRALDEDNDFEQQGDW